MRNTSICTLCGSSLLRFLSQINPAVLKSLSDETVAGGIERYCGTSCLNRWNIFLFLQYCNTLSWGESSPSRKYDDTSCSTDTCSVVEVVAVFCIMLWYKLHMPCEPMLEPEMQPWKKNHLPSQNVNFYHRTNYIQLY